MVIMAQWVKMLVSEWGIKQWSLTIWVSIDHYTTRLPRHCFIHPSKEKECPHAFYHPLLTWSSHWPPNVTVD